MQYKVESSWFPGDYGSWNKEVAAFQTLEEAIAFIKTTEPDIEDEWNIRDAETKRILVFTRKYYNEMFVWEGDKLVQKLWKDDKNGQN